jgi:hypothetical protein
MRRSRVVRGMTVLLPVPACNSLCSPSWPPKPETVTKEAPAANCRGHLFCRPAALVEAVFLFQPAKSKPPSPRQWYGGCLVPKSGLDRPRWADQYLNVRFAQAVSVSADFMSANDGRWQESQLRKIPTRSRAMRQQRQRSMRSYRNRSRQIVAVVCDQSSEASDTLIRKFVWRG